MRDRDIIRTGKQAKVKSINIFELTISLADSTVSTTFKPLPFLALHLENICFFCVVIYEVIHLKANPAILSISSI